MQALLFHAALAYLAAGVCWDVAGSFRLLPPWWPPVGYALLALGIAAFCMGLLVRILQTPRGSPTRPLLTLLELAAVGVVLAALVLRGDAEIPADPPLVVAEVVACAVLLLPVAARRRARRTAATGSSRTSGSAGPAAT